ncbi:Protein of unknown function [Pyronema omphalodes CBS 100304]|uniref:Uncharacterized protein n=1 Tax=Pyronema omphalodes (strain CBS 100304) TaxID=1076935 RepID=U4LA41_PYROM|nr:Protein of unknown function [Pyronema omphalodes CBS 100304]
MSDITLLMSTAAVANDKPRADSSVHFIGQNAPVGNLSTAAHPEQPAVVGNSTSILQLAAVDQPTAAGEPGSISQPANSSQPIANSQRTTFSQPTAAARAPSTSDNFEAIRTIPMMQDWLAESRDEGPVRWFYGSDE